MERGNLFHLVCNEKKGAPFGCLGYVADETILRFGEVIGSLGFFS